MMSGSMLMETENARRHDHPGRVSAHRFVDEIANIGEGDDAIEQLSRSPARQTDQRGVHTDVFGTGQVRVESAAPNSNNAAIRPLT